MFLKLEAPAKPQRIVSLVPSITELLHHFQLQEEVKGITKFCVHPPQWFRQKTRIGGTKQIHIEQVLNLQPDLVIASKEENVPDQVWALAQQVPVWLTDVKTYLGALQMITDLGSVCNRADAAARLILQIETKFSTIQSNELKLPAIYVIWQKPEMVAGGDTFIHAMMEKAGFHNLFSHALRYPEIRDEEIRQAGPKLILLSSEPYPFSERHRAEWASAYPRDTIRLVDGEMFSWYGSRMLHAPAYFQYLKNGINLQGIP